MSDRAPYDSVDYIPHRFSEELQQILETESSDRFIDGMRYRMIVSFFKYGRISEGFPERISAIQSLLERLEKYQETGNVEWLIDVANFAMIEFMHPSHQQAHFKGTDSDESPGRFRKDSAERHDPNRPVDRSLEALKKKYGSSND